MKIMIAMLVLAAVSCASPDGDDGVGEWDVIDRPGDTGDSVVVVPDDSEESPSDIGQDSDTVVVPEETAADHTWTDATTGYEWSAGFGATRMATHIQAVAYCESLVVDGKSGWELASIEELRTLIRRCPDTMSGGSCSLEDNFFLGSHDCSDCYNPLDPRAEWFTTPEVIRHGGVNMVTSSTFQRDIVGNYWAVLFQIGGLTPSSPTTATGYLCVR